MKLPLSAGARLRVALSEKDHPRDLCGIMPSANGRTALEWTAESLRSGDDAGANLVVRQAPAVRGVHLTGNAATYGLPGFLADSLPDAWGTMLVDRQLRRQGISPGTLRGFDRLAVVGARGTGALVYQPEVPLTVDSNVALDLDELAIGAETVLRGEDARLLDLLERVGGSAGGSRPKAWIAEDVSGRLRSGAYSLDPNETGWLVKFRAPRHDPEDIGSLEFAYASMAQAAGLQVPKPKLFETQRGRYFAGQRFDRVGAARLHVLTAAGLLDVAADRALAADYVDLLKLTRHVTRSDEEVQAAFRHAVFNVVASNRDDHLKQFAFIREDSVWRRAPAYDLTFSSGPGGEHTLLVAGEGRTPGRSELLTLAHQAGLRAAGARRVIEEVLEALSHWKSVAAASGVGRTSAQRVAEAITTGIDRCRAPVH